MEWKIIFFISEIPDKNKFTVQDAIVGELPVIEEDSVKSEQFQIFNFLSNVRLPKFPDILNNMIRPQPGPSDNQRPPPLQRPPPQFIPSPQNNLNNPNHKIPNHQHQSSQSQAANEALTVFNQGLDNFIQNPASLAHVSRPVNGWGEHILLCLFYIHLHICTFFLWPFAYLHLNRNATNDWLSVFSGRNFAYERALRVIEDEEYLEDIDFVRARHIFSRILILACKSAFKIDG